MSAFAWTAVDARGKELRGVIEADTARLARSMLRQQGLFPLEVDSLGEAAPDKRRRSRLSASQLNLLTRQWATLIAAGLTIEQALRASRDQSEEEKTTRLLSALRADVMAGHALSAALDEYPAAFPPIYRALVRAGEKSGELGAVLTRLADHLENSDNLRQKVLQALLYPALVTLIAGIVIFALMTWVAPQVIDSFSHSQQELPWITRALVQTSNLLAVVGPWLLFGGVAALLLLQRLLRIAALRLRAHQMLLRLRFPGRLLRGLDSVRFAQTLGILVGGGVPILPALAAGRDVLLLLPLQRAVNAVIREVEEGAGLAVSLGRQKCFPPLLVHLIASGESSGDLVGMLERAARQQQNETHARIVMLTTVLEPLLIVLMGAVVLVIVLAMLLPIIEINQLVL